MMGFGGYGVSEMNVSESVAYPNMAVLAVLLLVGPAFLQTGAQTLTCLLTAQLISYIILMILRPP